MNHFASIANFSGKGLAVSQPETPPPFPKRCHGNGTRSVCDVIMWAVRCAAKHFFVSTVLVSTFSQHRGCDFNGILIQLLISRCLAHCPVSFTHQKKELIRGFVVSTITHFNSAPRQKCSFWRPRPEGFLFVEFFSV